MGTNLTVWINEFGWTDPETASTSSLSASSSSSSSSSSASSSLSSPTTLVYSGSSCDNTSACVAVPTNGSMSHCKPQEYYSPNYAIVGTLFQSIIFIIGVLGNVLVCAVVRRTRSMHSTTNCYLVSLAVADTITLVASVPQEVLSYHILGDQWVWGPVGCSLIIYLQYLGIDASALSLTAFTVERYIAICHPMKSKSICTISRAKKIIGACWVFAIGYCSPWFFLTQTRTVCVQGVGDVTTCGFRLSRNSTEYLIMFFTDILLFYVLPLILSVVLYLLIARMLLTNSRNKFPGGLSNGTAMSVSEAAAKSNQSRVQVVKMLACVVMIFATLWVPYRGLLVYNSLATINNLPPYLDLWYLMFAKTCIYMNCAINPILYNAMSDKFRKAFRRLLSCGKLTEPAHNHLYCYNQEHSRLSPHPAANTTTTNFTTNHNHSSTHSSVQRTLSSPRYVRSFPGQRSSLLPPQGGGFPHHSQYDLHHSSTASNQPTLSPREQHTSCGLRRHSAVPAISCSNPPQVTSPCPRHHLSPNWSASPIEPAPTLELEPQSALSLSSSPGVRSKSPSTCSSKPMGVSVATQAGRRSKETRPKKSRSILSVFKPSHLTARSLSSSKTQETIF